MITVSPCHSSLPFFRSQKFSQAKECFAEGLSILQSAFRDCSETAPPPSNLRLVIFFSPRADADVAMATEEERPERQSHLSGEIQSLAPAQYFLQMQDPRDSAVDLDYLVSQPSTCLIYNTGLAIQAMAMTALQEQGRMTRTTEQRFQSAAQLYAAANDLQIHQEADIGCPMFRLSLFNNTGRCYELLGESNASGQCFERLLQALVIIQQSPHLFEEQMQMIQGTQTFHYNTASLILKDSGFAPAA